MINEDILQMICNKMLYNKHIDTLNIFINQYGAYFHVPLYEKEVGKKCNHYLSEANLNKVLIVHKTHKVGIAKYGNSYILHERDSAKKSDIDTIINLYRLRGLK